MFKLFEIQEITESHFSMRICGVKFNILKPQVKKERKKILAYYQSFSSPSDIPPAEGGLRLIQKANAVFLKQFNDFCEQNELSYWMDFGTLLGAVRHKGFIPWDDDIDVSMVREDYEKLIKICVDGKLPNTDISLRFENNARNKCFVKLAYKNSKNLQIDIFPYDYYYAKVSNDEKPVLSDLIARLSRKLKGRLFAFGSADEIRNEMSKITQKVINEGKNIDKTQMPAIFMGLDFPHAWRRKVYDYEIIFPLSEIKFEEFLLKAPNNCDAVLKSIFGNYMSLPKDCFPKHTNHVELSEDEQTLLKQLGQ